MNRKTFLQETAFAFTAVCLACASCTKNNKEELQASNNSVVLSLDLNTQLLNTGDFLVSSNIIVVRLSTSLQPTSFTAVQRDCTHAGGLLFWDKTAQRFICPVHGSEFDSSGVVLMGPAFNNLKKYKINIQNNQLLISA